MALTSFTASTLIQSAQVNSNFSAFKIISTYTGTGFDSTISSASSATASYETPLIAAATLANADYIDVKITFKAGAGSYGTNGGTNTAQLKLEEKYNGGAYGTVYDQIVSNWTSATANDAATIQTIRTFDYVYTLTANDKANGLYFKITSTSTSASAATATLSNVQTVLVLMA